MPHTPAREVQNARSQPGSGATCQEQRGDSDAEGGGAAGKQACDLADGVRQRAAGCRC